MNALFLCMPMVGFGSDLIYLLIALGVGIGSIILVILAAILFNWRILAKAGYAGWAALVPIYSGYLLFKLSDLPPYLAFLQVIPIIGLIPTGILLFKMPKAFGQEGNAAWYNLFFPFLYYPYLAFSGKLSYQGSQPGPRYALNRETSDLLDA